MHYFGAIENREMTLSNCGVLADICWHEIPNHSKHVELGAFVVMPNHIHGILILDKPAVQTLPVVETLHATSLQPNEKITWLVTDTLIDASELKQNTDWLNTSIVWQLQTEDEIARVHVTQIGLLPKIECYEVCSKGWRQFCNSLKQFLEKEKETPFKSTPK